VRQQRAAAATSCETRLTHPKTGLVHVSSPRSSALELPHRLNCKSLCLGLGIPSSPIVSLQAWGNRISGNGTPCARLARTCPTCSSFSPLPFHCWFAASACFCGHRRPARCGSPPSNRWNRFVTHTAQISKLIPVVWPWSAQLAAFCFPRLPAQAALRLSIRHPHPATIAKECFPSRPSWRPTTMDTHPMSAHPAEPAPASCRLAKAQQRGQMRQTDIYLIRSRSPTPSSLPISLSWPQQHIGTSTIPTRQQDISSLCLSAQSPRTVFSIQQINQSQ
jgi:hypothetical protein